MRMWMVNPKVLCSKHLSGEHLETHMFVGTLRKGISVQGYIDNNLFEPKELYFRHELLKAELDFRKIAKTKKPLKVGHKSELERKEVFDLIEKLPKDIREYKIDRAAALEDLLNRCPECKARAEKLLSQGKLLY